MLRTAVVGATGYSGAELVNLLLSHPHSRIVGLFGSAKRDGQQPFEEAFPRFRDRLDLAVQPGDADSIAAAQPHAVFLATPHEASAQLAPALIERGIAVFDLSAAFRLGDAGQYPRHYAFEHPHATLLARAVYGLAEINRERLRTADLIAVPGCYPTSAILPLLPLVRAGAIVTLPDGRLSRPIIDSTSGVSGAGRALHQRSLFCEVHQQAYGVLKHRHQPEIDEHAGIATLFTPHLGPYERGILSTIHVDLAPGWDESRVRRTLEEAYGGEAFIRLCRTGVWPSVADVRGTNFCDIALAVDEPWRHLIITSAIDNLVKGAAGQAVQCFNIRFGFPETASLLTDNNP
ncbi:MAG: N-acetyl-gamma-glutamyl-phosphate reductase [Phycisphaerales bacterium]|nr:N-acetyl-gamma-glutamyl-phosphate reductase [Phycisphaerales bacterium]